MQFRLRNPSMRLAFALMVSICLFQDNWRSSVSAANMMVLKHFVSSANIAILELRTTLGMSFT